MVYVYTHQCIYTYSHLIKLRFPRSIFLWVPLAVIICVIGLISNRLLLLASPTRAERVRRTGHAISFGVCLSSPSGFPFRADRRWIAKAVTVFRHVLANNRTAGAYSTIDLRHGHVYYVRRGQYQVHSNQIAAIIKNQITRKFRSMIYFLIFISHRPSAPSMRNTYIMREIPLIKYFKSRVPVFILVIET